MFLVIGQNIMKNECSISNLTGIECHVMARSITSAPIPPGHLSGIYTLLLPHGGAFAKEDQPGGGASSKTTRSFGL